MTNRRYLIIRLGAHGDVIHALPLAAALREARPSAYIGWAVEPGPAALLEGNPDVDEVLILDTRAWRRDLPWGALSALRRDAEALRRFGADVALDVQGLFKSGFISWLSGAGVRVGFEQRACREGTNAVFSTCFASPPEGPHHVVEKNLSLLKPLGIPPPRKEKIRFPLTEKAEEAERAEAFLHRQGFPEGSPVMIIHPGAGWETKKWREARYAALGDAWMDMTGGGILISWGPGEEKTVSRMVQTMRRKPKVAPPTSFRELAALLRRCALFAGADSGPMHLAAALGVPCLAVLGPTDPVRNGPWGEGHATLHRKIACSGCYSRTCPDVECLERADAESAVRLLAGLWKRHANH